MSEVIIHHDENFERALKHIPKELEGNDYIKGVQGVVKQFGWRNPHPYIVWELKQSDGTVVSWTGELPGPIVEVRCVVSLDVAKQRYRARTPTRHGEVDVIAIAAAIRGAANSRR